MPTSHLGILDGDLVFWVHLGHKGSAIVLRHFVKIAFHEYSDLFDFFIHGQLQLNLLDAFVLSRGNGHGHDHYS